MTTGTSGGDKADKLIPLPRLCCRHCSAWSSTCKSMKARVCVARSTAVGRSEFREDRAALRASIEECAVADAVDARDKQATRYFDTEMMRSREAVGDLHTYVRQLREGSELLREHARHFDGIRDESDNIYHDLNDIEDKSATVKTRVGDLQSQGAQRLVLQLGWRPSPARLRSAQRTSRKASATWCCKVRFCVRGSSGCLSAKTSCANVVLALGLP